MQNPSTQHTTQITHIYPGYICVIWKIGLAKWEYI